MNSGRKNKRILVRRTKEELFSLQEIFNLDTGIITDQQKNVAGGHWTLTNQKKVGTLLRWNRRGYLQPHPIFLNSSSDERSIMDQWSSAVKRSFKQHCIYQVLIDFNKCLPFSTVICKWFIQMQYSHHEVKSRKTNARLICRRSHRRTSRKDMRARRLREVGNESLKHKTCIQKHRSGYLLNELTSRRSWRKDNTAPRKTHQCWRKDRCIFVLSTRCHATTPIPKWSVLRTIMLELDLLSMLYHLNRGDYVLSRFWYQRAHQIMKDHGWEFVGAYLDEEVQIYVGANVPTWPHPSASSGRPLALLSRMVALSNTVASPSADLTDPHFPRSWKRWEREYQSDFLKLKAAPKPSEPIGSYRVRTEIESCNLLTQQTKDNVSRRLYPSNSCICFDQAYFIEDDGTIQWIKVMDCLRHEDTSKIRTTMTGCTLYLCNPRP